MTNTYQLKVTLCDIEPEIWRRIVVPGSLDLGRLHKIIQDAMGWENAHLHSFEELIEWAPPGWSPDRFDLELADRRVARHGTPPGRSRAANKKRSPRTSASR